MVLDFDRNQNLTTDQKIQSLMESVQMALNEKDDEIARLKAELSKHSDDIAFLDGRHVVATKETSSATSIAAGAYQGFSITITKTGCTPIGIVGLTATGSNSGGCAVVGCYLSSATEAQVNVRNVSTSSATYKPRVYVLYRKNK